MACTIHLYNCLSVAAAAVFVIRNTNELHSSLDASCSLWILPCIELKANQMQEVARQWLISHPCAWSAREGHNTACHWHRSVKDAD